MWALPNGVLPSSAAPIFSSLFHSSRKGEWLGFVYSRPRELITLLTSFPLQNISSTSTGKMGMAGRWVPLTFLITYPFLLSKLSTTLYIIKENKQWNKEIKKKTVKDLNTSILILPKQQFSEFHKKLFTLKM